MDYLNLQKNDDDWTKSICGRSWKMVRVLHKAETDIDQIIELDNSYNASSLYIIARKGV